MVAQVQENSQEERAATRIQTTFRGFLTSSESFERIGETSGPCEGSCCQKTGCSNSALYASFGESSGSCSCETCSRGPGKSDDTTKYSATTCSRDSCLSDRGNICMKTLPLLIPGVLFLNHYNFHVNSYCFMA